MLCIKSEVDVFTTLSMADSYCSVLWLWLIKAISQRLPALEAGWQYPWCNGGVEWGGDIGEGCWQPAKDWESSDISEVFMREKNMYIFQALVNLVCEKLL